jgi:steroid delta-isomerase-like uncharacterized protein
MTDGPTATDESLLRRYYALFNERSLTEASDLVAPDCVFDHVPSKERTDGPEGYLALAERWLRASPDIQSTVEDISQIEAGVYRVRLVIQGTFAGAFEPSSSIGVAGEGRSFTLRATQRVRIRDGKIAASRLTYARQDLAGEPEFEGPRPCPSCGERNTVLAWTRMSEQWMFCPICEHSWEHTTAVSRLL